MQRAAFESSFFRIEPLAEGVYAAIVTDEVLALGNAGIVSLGSETLIFDTFLTPRAAQDLRAAAEQLTRQPVGWVVNSHWHGDHVLGNQVFAPPAAVISTSKTRQLVAKGVPAQIETAQRQLPEQIQTLREQAESESDPAKRQAMLQGAAGLEGQLRVMQALKLTLPQLTFDSRLDLHGSQRTATLLTYGEGHTESDAFLWLPDEGIVFAGDLVVIEGHPWMGHGNPDHWIGILDRMASLGVRAIVPGHGPVGTVEAIQPVQSYLRDIAQLVRDAVQAGKSKAEVEALKIPAAYEKWSAPQVFAGNISALYDKLSV
jgi:cyclase